MPKFRSRFGTNCERQYRNIGRTAQLENPGNKGVERVRWCAIGNYIFFHCNKVNEGVRDKGLAEAKSMNAECTYRRVGIS
jgi:hypothetical protein